jgi:hypothetical protein
MGSLQVDPRGMEWGSAVEFYGPGAQWDGQEIVQLKVLSDRRGEGGGVAWLVRFLPPAGKLIKIVAVARSDEHIWSIEGGRTNKRGERVTTAGGYALNTRGQPHSAMIAGETVSLVMYLGEPDEIISMEVVDLVQTP